MDVAPPDWRPDGVFVQAGASARDARVAGLGLRWDGPSRARAWGAGWHGAMQVSVGAWSTGVTRAEGQVRAHAVQVVAMPLVRWQPRQGASAWFLEAGLGLSVQDRRHEVGHLRQSSRLNFQEEVAAGRMLGGGQALSLRLAHMSNAGLRKPNPGETWWSLRWDVAF
jgi:hypothetical protein